MLLVRLHEIFMITILNVLVIRQNYATKRFQITFLKKFSIKIFELVHSSEIM